LINTDKMQARIIKLREMNNWFFLKQNLTTSGLLKGLSVG